MPSLYFSIPSTTYKVVVLENYVKYVEPYTKYIVAST